ncbi:MAG: DUF2442 domain-containing protein [Alphaproteobacteria bacterium]|nr:DUF2442 domain-containing protein [Alphaproteobacteria bacterium]
MKHDPVTDSDLDRAVQAGQRRMANEFRASAVRFDVERDIVELAMEGGWWLAFRRADVAEFADVDPVDMAKIELSPAGMGIEIEARDIHVGVHGLVSSFISPHLMASSLGRLGGGATSDAKRRSARENGKKGGRPRKVA